VHAIDFIVSPTILDGDVLPFLIAGLAQALQRPLRPLIASED
jgi:hypothetical protein